MQYFKHLQTTSGTTLTRRPTKFPGPEEPNTIVQSPPRCHLRIKISTFVNLEGLFFLQKLPSILNKVLMACQVCQGNFHLTWRLFHINQTGPQMTCLGHYLKPFHVSNGSKCSSNESRRSSNLAMPIVYRYTDKKLIPLDKFMPTLHQLVGKSPEFFKIPSNLWPEK